MSEISSRNPAIIAAEKALESIYDCINKSQSFLLEAGAGAGKTHSLIKSLQYLIDKKGNYLLQRNQQVACITYTNVATDEIKSRTDGHPAILASTIHAFCWSLIKDFQPYMKEHILLIPKWLERITEVEGIGARKIEYDLGHPSIKDDSIFLGHNDVLTFMVGLMEHVKFRNLFISRYPILLVDEYQDTDKNFAQALVANFLEKDSKLFMGFFGDHWQKIYGDGCGKLESKKLHVIGKGANFRSAPVIVDALNHMRPGLIQEVKDPSEKGYVSIYHTNSWTGPRQTGQHWGGDLTPDIASKCLDVLIQRLKSEGWEFKVNKTKILMLTHRTLGAMQGYGSFYDVFEYSESYIKKENPLIEFFADVVEPVCAAFLNKKYGEMFEALGERTPKIHALADKVEWAKDMDGLMKLRETGTIGDVIDYLSKSGRPRFPERVKLRIQEYQELGGVENPDEPVSITEMRKLRNVPYKEMIALDQFIDDQALFSTKHGVKGAQFENVLIVFGRGWNQYDFNQMLDWVETGIPSDKGSTFERNRNLFYVACSRPEKRLALLFTQKLSSGALTTLSNWFGKQAIHSIEIP